MWRVTLYEDGFFKKISTFLYLQKLLKFVCTVNGEILHKLNFIFFMIIFVWSFILLDNFSPSAAHCLTSMFMIT